MNIMVIFKLFFIMNIEIFMKNDLLSKLWFCTLTYWPPQFTTVYGLWLVMRVQKKKDCSCVEDCQMWMIGLGLNIFKTLRKKYPAKFLSQINSLK